MKKIDITELMDSYTDNEFNIGGEAGVEAEKVVSAVLPQVKQKKKMKPLFKVIAAAAAAVVLAGAATAAAIISSGVFTGASGTEYHYDLDDVDGHTGFGRSWNGDDINYLMTLENDRLYLNVDGEHIDITDHIDRKTPYIYSYTVPETGNTGYVIAGGTTEEYGVVELTYIAGWGWTGNGAVNSDFYGENNGGIIDVGVREEFIPAEIHGANHHFSITYRLGDNERRHSHDDNASIVYLPIPPLHLTTATPVDWREECVDAWIIEAFVRLDLIELYE